MRAWLGIVALVAMSGDTALAQMSRWHIDLGAATLVEAWDRNVSREALNGVVVGVDRHVWRPFAVRAEGTVLHVAQGTPDGWLRGFTLGTRARWRVGSWHPFVDLAFGLSHSTTEIPPGGTASNYLIVSGGGVEIPVRGVVLELGGRWFHVSNNGREGRGRNPDIQSLGAVVAVGWRSRGGG